MTTVRHLRSHLLASALCACTLLVALSSPARVAAVTFTVNSNVDLPDADLNNPAALASNGLTTLRAAIMQANKTAGHDIINIQGGIGDITLNRGQPDNDGQGTNDEASGDLDITGVVSGGGGSTNPANTSNLNNLTINGAAGGTVIQVGAFTAYPVNGGGSINTDRIFDIGQDGIFGGGFGGSTGISVTLTNLILRNGNVREALNTALGGGNRAFGGAIRYDGFGIGLPHGTLTLTNCTINNNQADNAGGGLYAVTGTLNVNGTTFSNNITKAGEGGGLFFGAATSNSNVNITNSTFTANEARQGVVFGTFTANADGGGLRINADPNTVAITNTNFTNNIAQQDGGAIKTLGGAVTVTGGTLTGNTARRHGGAIYGDQDTANTGRSFTISGATLRNNTANSDNVVGANDEGDAGDGGAIFRDRGVLNITNCIIGGTAVGEPNTATNGGGVAHAFTVDSAAGNSSNQTTITINGGSINGNVANADGGGVYFNSQFFDVAGGVLNIGPNTATLLAANKAKNNGGALHVSSGATAFLNNMTLRSNQANSDNAGGGDGGAFFQNSAAGIGGTTFTGSLTIGGSGFANQAVNGGGIRNNGGTLTLPPNASITHNTATGTGGGISNASIISAVNFLSVTNNTATGNGGGIFNSGTLGTLTNASLTNNSAASGGGLFSSNGTLSVSGGSISSNSAGGGVVHSGAATSSISGATINNNTGHGILITANSLDVINSTITGNTLDGIAKTGSGTGSHFNSNVIHSNGGLAVDLADDGVTANDANDVDTGANNLQNYPLLNFVRRGTGVAGVTLNAPNGKYRIQYYANTACDPAGNGEGQALLATEIKDIVAGSTLTYFSTPLAFGARELISATATHDANGNGDFNDDGSTSEFAVCRQVNRLPTISAASVSKQQGSPVSTLGIATVADADQAANTLTATVNGGSSAVVNGVTVSNLTIAPDGTVNASVIASCTATNATFTVRVTDLASEFNEASVTVTVPANTAPTLGDYPATAVLFGSSGSTSGPNAAPGDNGSIASLTASAPSFTGSFAGNTSSGEITVNNAGPVGPHTVTVTATDNCGSITTKQFTLTVNRPPSITSASGVTFTRGTFGTFTVTTVGYPAPTLTQPSTLPSGVTFVDNGNGTATLSGTPAVNTGGPYSFTITAANGIGSNATQMFTLQIVTTAQNYMAQYGLTGSEAAFTFDKEGDGIENGLEYALSLDPTSNNLAGLPVVVLKDYSGTKYLSITFTRSAIATDLTYIVEGSSDLTTWTALATSTGGGAMSGAGFVSETPSGNLFNVEVRDTVPFSAGGAPRFLRLKVTSP